MGLLAEREGGAAACVFCVGELYVYECMCVCCVCMYACVCMCSLNGIICKQESLSTSAMQVEAETAQTACWYFCMHADEQKKSMRAVKGTPSNPRNRLGTVKILSHSKPAKAQAKNKRGKPSHS